MEYYIQSTYHPLSVLLTLVMMDPLLNDSSSALLA
jgi:hypothetical protein